MDFHEKSFTPNGHGGPGERRHEFPPPGGACARPARQLDAVGRIEDDRIAEPAHDRQRAEVRDEVVIPERGDRKSTRLNSSHLVISYAVFCLKKKANAPPWRRKQRRQARMLTLD